MAEPGGLAPSAGSRANGVEVVTSCNHLHCIQLAAGEGCYVLRNTYPLGCYVLRNDLSGNKRPRAAGGGGGGLGVEVVDAYDHFHYSQLAAASGRTLSAGELAGMILWNWVHNAPNPRGSFWRAGGRTLSREAGDSAPILLRRLP